mmetsp:Transcript_33878/g.86608  ORF Transcript_33878/g.86608 Transcript_33878/m.86608 type:complete len:211 (+) Transcript_33878:677-1309(+)
MEALAQQAGALMAHLLQLLLEAQVVLDLLPRVAVPQHRLLRHQRLLALGQPLIQHLVLGQQAVALQVDGLNVGREELRRRLVGQHLLNLVLQVRQTLRELLAPSGCGGARALCGRPAALGSRQPARQLLHALLRRLALLPQRRQHQGQLLPRRLGSTPCVLSGSQLLAQLLPAAQRVLLLLLRDSQSVCQLRQARLGLRPGGLRGCHLLS